MNKYIQANTDGVLHDARLPTLSPLNRGFLYGDAIYEVWRTYHGTLFAWEEHWARLERSAQALAIDIAAISAERILEEIKKTATAFRLATASKGELYIRLQISRGEGSIGLDINLSDHPRFVILIQENPQFSSEKSNNGVTLSLARSIHRNDARCLNPAWKTGNYLNNIQALREAKSRGADEVLMTNLQGELTEAAVCNVFFCKNNTLHTPSSEAGILEGITRQIILESICPKIGIQFSTTKITEHDLPGMQECFIASTTKDITPVKNIDSHSFAVGSHSLTARLKNAFAEYALDYSQRHPALKLP